MAIRDVENRVYQDNLAIWLTEHNREWVAIEGDIIIGFFPSYESAYVETATAVNSRDFFLKEVAARYQDPRRPSLRPTDG